MVKFLAFLVVFSLLLAPFILAGDFNSDGQVNGADLSILLSEYGNVCGAFDNETNSTMTCQSDFDRNGRVGVEDYAVLLTFFANTNINFSEVNEVTQCMHLATPGVYRLSQDVISSGSCFYIDSDDVILDCDNHKINSALNFSEPAITGLEHDSVAIVNCIVEPVQSAGAVELEKMNSLLFINFNASSEYFDRPTLEIRATEASFFNSHIRNFGENGSSLVWREGYLNLIEGSSFESNGTGSVSTILESVQGRALKGTIPSEVRNSLFHSVGVGSYPLSLFNIDNLDFYGNSFVQETLENNGPLSASPPVLNKWLVEAMGYFSAVFHGNRFIGAPGINSDLNGSISYLKLENNSFDSNFRHLSWKSPVHGKVYFIDQNMGNVNFKSPGSLVRVERTGKGFVDILDSVIFSTDSLDDKVFVGDEEAFVSPDLGNFSAKIMLYTSLDNPEVFRDGSSCSECSNVTFGEGYVSFFVNGSGSYTLQTQESLSSSSPADDNGGRCRASEWICGDWSSCVDGQQTRACVQNRPQCNPPLIEKPATLRACVVESLVSESEEPTNEEGFFNTITGAVIGVGNVLKNGFVVAVLALLLIAFIVVRQMRKRRKL